MNAISIDYLGRDWIGTHLRLALSVNDSPDEYVDLDADEALGLLNHLEEHRAAIEAEVRASVGAARWQIVGDEVARLTVAGVHVHAVTVDPWEARDAGAEGLGVLVIDIGGRVDDLPEGEQIHVRASQGSTYIHHLVQIADGVYVMAVGCVDSGVAA